MAMKKTALNIHRYGKKRLVSSGILKLFRGVGIFNNTTQNFTHKRQTEVAAVPRPVVKLFTSFLNIHFTAVKSLKLQSVS